MNSTKLVSKQSVAEGTTMFLFEKPAGFEYRAGQSIDLTLINPPETDAEGNTRAFSLVSSPFDPELAIATRMRDTAFKRVLGKLPEASELNFDGPFGSLTLHNNTAKPAVFLAGGIGITPFRSIIRQSLHDATGHQLYLFYSNRRPEDAPFLDELTALAAQHQNFRCITTMTEMEKSQQPWQGERGFITPELVKKHLSDLTAPIFYLAGPPKMVAAMYQLLVGLNVDTDNIRTEEFSGY